MEFAIRVVDGRAVSVCSMEAATRRNSPTARAGVLGAFSAAAAVMLVMPAFYPLARVFDPTAGGDVPYPLSTDLKIGAVMGALLSPVAAGIGAVLGLRIGNRRIRLRLAGSLIAVAPGPAVCFFVALNGGLIDESGSISSLLFVTTLGALAGTVSVSIFASLRQVVSVEQTTRASQRSSG